MVRTLYKDPRLPHFSPIKSVGKAKREYHRTFSLPREKAEPQKRIDIPRY